MLATKLKNVQYNPKRYHPIILRLQEPKCTINIFASGKLVCTGTSTKSDALKGCQKATCRIAKVYPSVQFRNFTFCNFVYSGNFNQPINLSTASLKFKHCIYEPELFPGMKICVPPLKTKKKSNLVCLLFHTGKYICTGIKCENDVSYVYSYLINKLGIS